MKNLVANAVKECFVDITEGIAVTVNDKVEGKFMSFKRQFIDESASSVELALKKVKRDPHQFNPISAGGGGGGGIHPLQVFPSPSPQKSTDRLQTF